MENIVLEVEKMKRVFSFILCLVLFLTCFSVGALASDGFNLKVKEVTETSVTLCWEEKGNVSRYHVYRSTSSDSGFEQIATVKNEKYTDKNVSEDTTYYYKVRGSVGSVFFSYTDFSEILEVKTEKKVTFSLNKSYIKVGAKETYQLKATNGVKPVFSSDNESVATVDSNGKVKALKKGVAIITAESDGVTSQCTVDVRNTPKSISLGRKTLMLGVNEVYKFDIASNSGSASYSNKYTSSNKSVAVINSAREITALKPGKTTITMTSYNGLKATCVVTVKNEPESVRLNHESATISIGGTVDLDSFVNDGAGAYLKKYTSSNPEIAKVGKAGVITGVSEGEALITLTVYNGIKTTCKIKVIDAPYEIVYGKEKITMGVGESFKNAITVKGGSTDYTKTLKYSSSDKQIATVSADGTIKALKTGTAKITAESLTGLKTTCTVTVRKAPQSVSINTVKKTIFLNETYKLKITFPKDTASLNNKWTSSNTDVLTVNQSGVVTPVGKGTATVTFGTFNGKTVSSKITVRIVNFKKAYTAAGVRKDVAALAQTYPSLIKTDVIGHSVKGSPIPLIKLGRGEKEALITAGIHSREYLTIGFTMRCVEEYAAAYYSKTGKYGDYDMVKMLDEYTLYIVPMINPDGLDILTNGKKTLYDKSKKDETYKRNANGVNLNRNFPFEWDKVTDGSSTKYENYKGKSAASEPETQALIALCEAHDFEWLYSMHLYGNNVYWRDSKNGKIPGDEALVNKLNKVCGFIVSESTTDPNGYGGGFENWFRQAFNRPGFCVELVPLNQNYRYEISRTKEFDTLTNWSKTKYAFIQGMI